MTYMKPVTVGMKKPEHEQPVQHASVDFLSSDLYLKEEDDGAPKFRDTASFEEKYAKTLEVMDRMSCHRPIFYKTLELARQTDGGQDLVDAIYALPEMKLNVRSAQQYLESLYKTGALDREAQEQSEEDIEDEVPVSYIYSLSSVGAKVLEDLAPTHLLDTLFTDEADCVPGFMAVLAYCGEPRTREEVDGTLKDAGLLYGLDVASTYYLDRLEENGGLVYENGWHTTKAGEDYLEHEKQGGRAC